MMPMILGFSPVKSSNDVLKSSPSSAVGPVHRFKTSSEWRTRCVHNPALAPPATIFDRTIEKIDRMALSATPLREWT